MVEAVASNDHTGPVEALLLDLWRNRSQPGAVVAACTKLTEIVRAGNAALDAVEFYLPQFLHCLIHLPHELGGEAASLQRFLLAVCQVSSHIAVQFFWIVYSALEDNSPKRAGSDAVVHQRSSRLLLRLEQCVVYSAGAGAEESSDALMSSSIRLALRVSGEGEGAADAAASGADGVIYEGYLYKKGGYTSKWGRRKAALCGERWQFRYIQIRRRTLYYSSSKEAAEAGRVIGSLSLSSADACGDDDIAGGFGFSVRCRQSARELKLRAETAEERSEWIKVLQALSAIPQPPGIPTSLLRSLTIGFSSDDISDSISREALTKLVSASYAPHGGEGDSAQDLSEHRRSVYAHFTSQRDFIRALTNLAEELRALPKEARQAALQPGLDRITLPPFAYYPLTQSSDPLHTLLRFSPNEGIVFNTKARCPLLLVLETQRKPFTVASALTATADCPPVPTGGRSSSDPPPDAGLLKREAWDAKAARLQLSSPLATLDGWTLRSLIVKSNDDLRQEVFIMQLIRFCQRIFPSELCWLKPYHIQATGPDTGIIETITSSQDLDSIKKTKGYVSLKQLFISRFGDESSSEFKAAQDNFCRSLAAYSIVMWLLLLRDRHNGNLMLDDQGHYFHIDFGFVLGHSTGKQIGGLVECSNFKLTEEYVELLGGDASPVYEKFCDGCVQALRAARAHGEVICTLIEIMGRKSNLPCFGQTPVRKVIPRLRKRLLMHVSDDRFEAAARRIVRAARTSRGSTNYDKFQHMLQGYAV